MGPSSLKSDSNNIHTKQMLDVRHGLGIDSLAAPVQVHILADNDDAPWHDPSVPIGDRMAMAKDRP